MSEGIPITAGKTPEITLKSPGTRRHFQRVLTHNLRSLGLEAFWEGGFFFVKGEAPLERFFGVKKVAIGRLFQDYVEALEFARSKASPKAWPEVSRSYKGFSKRSLEIAREILAGASGESNIAFHVSKRGFLVFTEFKEGPGGLPLGSQRRLNVRVDEEIPAGYFLLMRRGSALNLESPPEWIAWYHVGRRIFPPRGVDAVITTRPETPGVLYPVAGVPERLLNEIEEKWIRRVRSFQRPRP